MASNKPGRGLDKPTRAAVSGLDAYLESCLVEDVKPDEWTLSTAYDRAVVMGSKMARSGFESKVQRDEKNGVIVSRKVLICGKWNKVYRVK